MESMCILQFSVMLLLLPAAESCGSSEYFRPVTVKETEEKGHVLLNYTRRRGEKWRVVYPSTVETAEYPDMEKWLSDALMLNRSNTSATVHVQLEKQLDLEFFRQRFNHTVSILKYRLICKTGGTDTSYELFVNIQPVNEFKPRFLGGPFNVSVPENTNEYKVLIRLRDKAIDRDVVTSGDSDIHEFIMTAIRLPWVETKEHDFIMDNKQDGEIRVGKPLDYETYPRPYMTYNVSVFDRSGQSRSTEVTFYIEDVDDQPPMFYHSGCETYACDFHYSCEVPYDFSGIVTDISPALIKAKDGDSLGYNVKYYMKTENRYVTINQHTGAVRIREPIGPSERTTDIVLTIRAQEDSEKRLSSDAILIVKIKYPRDHTTSATNQQSTRKTTLFQAADTSKIVMVSIVVLAMFVLVAFLTLGALIFFFKKRPDKPIYPAEEGTEEAGEAEDDADDADDKETDLQRGGSNTDSGHGSMRGGSTLAAQVAETSGQDDQGQAMARSSSRRSAARRTASSRSGEVSSGRMSRISVADIQPQEDPHNAAMMMQHYHNNMALVHAQMHAGIDVLAEEDETNLTTGGEISDAIPQPSLRPRPPKSAPAGPRSKATKAPKRAKTGRKQRTKQPTEDSPEDD